MATDQEELLRQYYELHPELAPKKAGLDPMFLENLLQNKGNPIPNPPMSVGSDAPYYSESDHPMSMSQQSVLKPELPNEVAPPPIQQIPYSSPKPQQSKQQAPIRQASDQEALGGMLSKPQDPTNDIMFGKNDLSTVENLKKAQQQRDSTQNSARMLRGAATLGEGLLGLRTHRLTGPDVKSEENTLANKLADDLEKNAGQPIQDLDQQVAMQKNDPNSAVSKGYRDMMKQFGVNVQGDASAADMEKSAPWLAKAYEGEQNREAKSQDLKYKYKELGTLAKLKGDEKEQAGLEKEFENLAKEIDPNRARSGEKGKNQARLNAAGRVTGLIESAGGNPSKIPMRELATTVANMLTMGGQTAVQQINELVPHTMAGDAAGIQEWLTGNPTGTDQQKFVQMYSKIAQREAKVARDQLRDAQFGEAYSRKHLKEKNPQRYYDLLSTAADMDPEEIKAMESEPGFRGRYKPSNYSEGQEKGIQKVMDTNKITRAEAIKALQKAGKL